MHCRHVPEGSVPPIARHSLAAAEDARGAAGATWREALGYKYVAVSHSHPDHIGNIAMFRSQCCWSKSRVRIAVLAGPRFRPELRVTKLEGVPTTCLATVA